MFKVKKVLPNVDYIIGSLADTMSQLYEAGATLRNLGADKQEEAIKLQEEASRLNLESSRATKIADNLSELLEGGA